MTALARPIARTASFSPVRIAWPRSHWLLFAVALYHYLALGAYLALDLHAMDRDAYSRVTNAYYVLFSRDPHLGAIGFVWSPLPSMVELLLVPFRLVWPPMVELGFAGVIMSAVFMAGAVHQLDRTLDDFQVPWGARLILVGAFALHPMIVYYAANGMSEAPMIFFLVLTARYLARWARDSGVDSLVIAGLGLSGAYLTRYETLFSAAGAAGVVVLLTLFRADGPARRRLDAAVADAAILLAPFALVFAGWAIAGWLIVGSPFPQFSSVYGNASQAHVAAAQGASDVLTPAATKALLAVRRMAALEVGLPLALGLALVVGTWRRDSRWLAVIGLFGPALAFMAVAYVANAVFPWLRFYILATPLAVILCGLAIGGPFPRRKPIVARGPGWRDSIGAMARRGVLITARLTRALIVIVALSLAVAAIPVAAAGMRDPVIATQEARDLAAILGPSRARDDRPGADLYTFATERQVAAYLDRLDLLRGSVLVDAFIGFAIVGQSRRPEQFVITSDRDFKAVLADPVSFRVRYVLAPDAVGYGVLDAVNVAYPNLLTSGAGFGRLERTFEPQGNDDRWYLFRVVSP